MTNPNPGHPSQKEPSPGSGEPVQAKPSAAPATPTNQQGNQGGQPEGTVTISAEEYRALQRDKARVLSFDKRKEFLKKNPRPATNEAGDPQVNEELQKRDEIIQQQNAELHREKVSNQVRNILAKPEYQALPESTRALILKNPAMLSDADNVEEALLDIEDFVREQVAGLKAPVNQQNGGQGAPRNANPAGHEAPPVVNNGAPAPSPAAGLEDVSNLRGAARSRAVLRNSLRKAKGAKA